MQRHTHAWCRPLGLHLHMLRRQRRETLAIVSKACGMRPVDLSRLERGLKPLIPFGAVWRLAQYYGVGLDTIVNGNGE
jgi:transcriptional regulator with XRE-family HTH domain